MIKVVMVGAGSIVFSRNLSGDILSCPEFRNAEMTYVDVDKERLEVGAELCRRTAKTLGAKPKIEATLDLRKALRGADFVINMVQIGGMNSTLVDFEIPRKYGLRFTVADTTGPGGLFRALRTYPMLTSLCQDMMELCPNAWLLNYTNPMSMNMQTVYRTSNVKGVGLCHSVQGTLQALAEYAKEDYRELEFICAGINHMAFFLKLEKGGEDLYPRVFEASKDPFILSSNLVRFEIMKRLGYFPTESSGHHAEYSNFFIPHGRDVMTRFAVPLDALMYNFSDNLSEFEKMRAIARSKRPSSKANKADPIHRSPEYASIIINSVATGKPSVIYGNMPNRRGAISNLPETAIVEAPTLVDRSGLAFAVVGDLPPQVAGYIQPHITQHELFIRAAMEGRRDHIYQAAMFDPLTSAMLTPDRIVAMCDELIACHGKALPNLDAKKTLVPSSEMNFKKTNPKMLRKEWEQNNKAQDCGLIRQWNLIGPFMSDKKKSISVDMMTPMERDFIERGTGTIDLRATWRDGRRPMKWIKARTLANGYLDCDKILGHHEFCFAYGYACVESDREVDAVLKIGSDDGNKIWLNGELVNRIETIRGYMLGSDEAKVRLQSGTNHLFFKLSQVCYGWGFGVSVVPT